ncbi:hypothetical protein Q5H93_16025 [Hymenobacter sp. ASUV-10]|uniref:DUF4190 domain-containing protein n=1 Tax=Hymenobacter aranciens TaxID=3063996 RepID=A0ABT9BIB3_9BACT|nr:hypothetical protein [Hymenobacter sp. ASUV-10]MDO7876253.1 hypothetical protein [Hymenobacter sp. ASUV-10]
MQSKGLLLAAGILLLLPPLLLFAFVVQQVVVSDADMKLWVLFLMSLTPCGLLATIGCLVALFRKSVGNQFFSKSLALGMLAGAVLELVGGLFAIGLVLLVVGALR